MTDREKFLCRKAEQHPDDNIANRCMKTLREEFDPTYIWCPDCDGMVVKEKDCCMNRAPEDNEETPIF